MATTDESLSQDFDLFSDDDYSVASLETDDGKDHLPERILGEKSGHGRTWYIVKWEDCSLLRSSWESPEEIQKLYPHIWDEWLIEKQRQAEGLSKPFDVDAFNLAVLKVEETERAKRKLRRLRRKFKRVLDLVS